MLAGMNVAAGPKLAAAVTNAGGIGVIGGVGYSTHPFRAADSLADTGQLHTGDAQGAN